jgi:hypothetical protein
VPLLGKWDGKWVTGSKMLENLLCAWFCCHVTVFI